MTNEQRRDVLFHERLSHLYSYACTPVSSQELSRDLLLCIVSALRSYSTFDIGRLHNENVQGDKLPDRVLCDILVSHLYPNGAWCGLELSSVQDSHGDCQLYCHSYDEHIRLLQEAAQASAPLLADALEHICLGQFAHLHNHARQDSDRLSSSDDSLLTFVISLLLKVYYTLYSTSRKSQAGRWPANVILTYPEDEHDAEGNLLPNPGKAEVLAGFPVTGGGGASTSPNNDNTFFIGLKCRPGWVHPLGKKRPGSAARYFYCAKASRRERNAGCEGFTAKVKDAEYRQPTGNAMVDRLHGCGKPMRNHHPTVKPLALTEYLARLILPPQRATPRRLLVPFSGSGSEIIGALRAGWDEVVGIDLDAGYCAIAVARIRHWQAVIAKERAAPQQAALFS